MVTPHDPKRKDSEELATFVDSHKYYRAFVGPAALYDTQGAMQFSLLTLGGLRDHHKLLDIGCGSLRAGRLFLPYLKPGNYFGIEPEKWLIEDGIDQEVGADQVVIKRPVFSHSSDFALSEFGVDFDFLLAHSIFAHATKPQIERSLAEARRVMRPTSKFFATLHIGRDDYEGSEWKYPEPVPYTKGWFEGSSARHGLACRWIDWPAPHRQCWVVLTRSDAPRDVAPSADASRVLKRAARRARMLRTPGIRALLAHRRNLIGAKR